MSNTQNQAKSALVKLLAYCRSSEWAGYDPYDALNSKLFSAVPVLNSRIPRLVLTQGLKRSPVNLRGLLAVPKTQNPKGLALFLSAFLRMAEADLSDRETLIAFMIDRLRDLRSPGTEYWCWGYSFPWQTRKEVVPAGTPNLVCTTFVANALLEAYEAKGDPHCLAMATSAAEYIVQDLYWTDAEKSIHSFSYPLPSIRVQVHNANFLAAALLLRVSKLTGDRKFVDPALAVTRCSLAKQKQAGSWDYGEGPKQHWIDNFHTGFNLDALRAIASDLGTTEFDDAIRRGFEFYRTHFFRDDGAPKYFHDRTYPIDIHCVSQSIITLTRSRDLDPSSFPLAQNVLRWALDNMWDDKGYFYYRVLRTLTIRTPYMRWSEAWMLLALASILQEQKPGTTDTQNEKATLVSASPLVNGND